MTSFLKSKIFKKALERALKIAEKPEKITGLVDSVKEKMSDLEEGKKTASDFFTKIKTLLRMLRAYINGQYRDVPWKSILLIIGALIYFLMPLDLMPDFLPVTGFVDDISIILMVYKSINSDIEEFLEFEKNNNFGDPIE